MKEPQNSSTSSEPGQWLGISRVTDSVVGIFLQRKFYVFVTLSIGEVARNKAAVQ